MRFREFGDSNTYTVPADARDQTSTTAGPATPADAIDSTVTSAPVIAGFAIAQVSSLPRSLEPPSRFPMILRAALT
jgi:hypothetical protein